jgi:hypothetical protein
MQFMLLVKATELSEAGELPTTEEFEAMGRFNAELVKAGVLLAAAGLQPSSKGKRVKFTGKDQRTVIDGPFTETKELIAGFWLIQAKSLEEATEWAKRCPNPSRGEGVIEIRQVFEPEDFGEAFTPELQAAEAEMLAEVKRQQQQQPQ